MSYETLRLEREGGIARLTLARPKVNAMSVAMLGELRAALDEVAADSDLHGLLVLGEGRAYSAGLDLKEVSALDAEGLENFFNTFDAAFDAAFRFPKPMAAAVQGHAIAGGLVLALCADHFVLGHGDYKLGLTELQVGIAFPRIAFEIVRHGLPPRALRALVYTAGLFGPQATYDLGVGDAISEQPESDASAWLEQFASRPMATFTHTKAQLRGESFERIDRDRDADRERLMQALRDGVARAMASGALG